MLGYSKNLNLIKTKNKYTESLINCKIYTIRITEILGWSK